MQRLILLGGNSRLAEAFGNLYAGSVKKFSKNECDITNYKQAKSIISSFKGKYVVNCAAITDIEDCQANPKKCFRVNTIAPKNLEKICQKYKKRLIQISSDYALFPKNNYGASKFIMEKVLDKKTLIIRTNFYDNENFAVKNILNDNKAKYYKNVFINPVSVNRLVREIYKNKEKDGLIKIFTDKKVSYYKFAHHICNAFDKNGDKLVKKSKFKNEKSKTKRPLNSVIDSDIKIDLSKDLLEFKKYLEKYYGD